MHLTDLPYHLPDNQQKQLLFLAKILELPRGWVINGGKNELHAMCGVILYRHLNASQRVEVMSLIRTLPRKLEGKLVSAALLTTYGNPQWGIWSLTNDELTKDSQFHTYIDTISSLIGITASGMGIKELAENAWKMKKIGKGGIVTLVTWSALILNKSELNKVNEEITRRKSVMKVSRFY